MLLHGTALATAIPDAVNYSMEIDEFRALAEAYILSKSGVPVQLEIELEEAPVVPGEKPGLVKHYRGRMTLVNPDQYSDEEYASIAAHGVCEDEEYNNFHNIVERLFSSSDFSVDIYDNYRTLFVRVEWDDYVKVRAKVKPFD